MVERFLRWLKWDGGVSMDAYNGMEILTARYAQQMYDLAQLEATYAATMDASQFDMMIGRLVAAKTSVLKTQEMLRECSEAVAKHTERVVFDIQLKE